MLGELPLILVAKELVIFLFARADVRGPDRAILEQPIVETNFQRERCAQHPMTVPESVTELRSHQAWSFRCARSERGD